MKEIKIKKPKQKRSSDKFDAILDACPRVFNEFGYEKSTTERLALEADVSVGTLYDYFSSKEAVFIAYLDRELSRALDAVVTKASFTHLDSHSMTREYVHIGIDFVYLHRDMLRVMASEYSTIIPELDFAKDTKEKIKCISKAFYENEKIRPKHRDYKVMMFTVTNIFLGFLFRMVAMPESGISREAMIDELTVALNNYVYGELPPRKK